jgi:hypothetical protein
MLLDQNPDPHLQWRSGSRIAKLVRIRIRIHNTTSRSFLKASSVGAPLYFTGQARILFVKLPYTLATEEAERIGLDHVAR